MKLRIVWWRKKSSEMPPTLVSRRRPVKRWFFSGLVPSPIRRRKDPAFPDLNSGRASSLGIALIPHSSVPAFPLQCSPTTPFSSPSSPIFRGLECGPPSPTILTKDAGDVFRFPVMESDSPFPKDTTSKSSTPTENGNSCLLLRTAQLATVAAQTSAIRKSHASISSASARENRNGAPVVRFERPPENPGRFRAGNFTAVLDNKSESLFGRKKRPAVLPAGEKQGGKDSSDAGAGDDVEEIGNVRIRLTGFPAKARFQMRQGFRGQDSVGGSAGINGQHSNLSGLKALSGAGNRWRHLNGIVTSEKKLVLKNGEDLVSELVNFHGGVEHGDCGDGRH
nr:hypothetical protein CR513_56232 [Ipomoea batatas]